MSVNEEDESFLGAEYVCKATPTSDQCLKLECLYGLSLLFRRSGQAFYRNPRPRKEDEAQPLPNSNVICYFDDWERRKVKSRQVNVIPQDVKSYLESVQHLIFVTDV